MSYRWKEILIDARTNIKMGWTGKDRGPKTCLLRNYFAAIIWPSGGAVIG